MSLTDTQLQTLATALRAETNQTCIDALAIRNDVALTEWVNSESEQDAWNPAMTAREMFESSDVTKFDGLTAGKRDSWTRMERFAPIDFSRNKMRTAVRDVWGNTDSVAVLQACTRKATNGEKYLGGTVVWENSVSAWKLTLPGNIGMSDIQSALNRF